MNGYPILTLFGRSHRRNDRGDLDLNEAVLLGPDGSELRRHRKLAPFTDYSSGEEYPCGENLETGTVVTVLECSLGNITPLICIDLLNTTVKDILSRSHGNFFPVPSLSPKTSAHQSSANELQPRTLASTFVCNHWKDGPPVHKTTSFYQVPARKGRRFHVPADAQGADRPYLLFDLLEVPE
jgi:predicted amidohydrolase